MIVVIAPDKFKGSLTAAQAADALAAGIGESHPNATIRKVPVADGGDGTVAAALAAGWEAVDVETAGPTGEPVTSVYAIRGDTAVIELANTVGLVLLPNGRMDPLGASTYGLGIVIAHALDRGARTIVIGLGGSASTDGGAGMLQALGVRILDAGAQEVERGGAGLLRADRLDLSALHPAVRDSRFVMACDVDNPLLGDSGAVAVYGPQKGAGRDDRTTLEAALTHWAGLVARVTGTDSRTTAGAGAAGGTGFGAIALLGAQQRPGADFVLELVGLADALAGADLVITGEGSLDEQSLYGKAPIGVAARAHAAGIPVVAVAGRSILTADQTEAAGFTAIHTLAEIEPDLARSMANAADLLREIGSRIAM
ncbi:glycerate kinase [Antrihabitans sp. YC2-6]|uniref:glycerate kinase n=1 Tax=Antrihabitans sp. YC2-6 TaxID=2799498 RepID=UPI0018F5C8D1|nr:glycerate kinase [Antrihabitans sp. YC2-6]MBJ8346469.1 glycerate kinase [Antrihabitans sp. YC2-6]